MEAKRIEIGSITANDQVRKEFDPAALAELESSIRQHGLLQPITIDSNNVIIFGERRFRACKNLGLTHIDCFVESGWDEEKVLIAQISENIQRSDLKGIEAAEAFAKLWKLHAENNQIEPDMAGDYRKGTTWLANSIGKSKSWVSQIMRLLDEPKEVQAAMKTPDADGETLKYSYVMAINDAPQQHRDKLREKLMDKSLDGFDKIKRLAKTLQTATPEQAENLLMVNYSLLEKEEVAEAIKTILEGTVAESAETDIDLIESASEAFIENLGKKRLSHFQAKDKIRLTESLEKARNAINSFFD